MEYLILDSDGHRYGPFDVETLRSWIPEGRLSPETLLEDYQSGRQFQARELHALYPLAAPPMIASVDGSLAASPYPRSGEVAQPALIVETYSSILTSSVMRACLALFCFTIIDYLGFILALFSLYLASKLVKKKNRHGKMAMNIAMGTLAFLTICWSLRQNGLF